MKGAYTRLGILTVFALLGPHASLATMRDLFPELARGALEEILRRARAIYRRKGGWLIHTLRWTAPGTVWAMDFTEPAVPIDGIWPHLLLVRDLARGKTLLALPCLGQRAEVVLAALRDLFAHHGPPLVLKMDNGSAFVSEEVVELLGRWGVLPLYSPPGTPAYNGAVEAGIGSLEVRAFYESARHDRPGEWTCEDVAVALRQANETARPRGAAGPTPDQAWAARRPVEESVAEAFRSAYHRQRGIECATRKIPTWQQPTAWLQRPIDRIAISRALIECGYLLIRRRRVTPPITARKWARIA